MSALTPEAMEHTIRRYFAACNAADFGALVDSFTPDAVHYFPPGLPDVPWRGAEAIARGWIWCVETLGSRWTIEKVLCSSTSPEAVIEWTHWKTKSGTALRGDEWYVFDEASGRISEIRAYYASPADKGAAINEWPGFDYAARGYHLRSP
ncbi:nuclear transport factor 2 family protein [Aureimonas flava]|uniref:Nuclear transport factor 2 family protein n=1 Tax=Aureimonas flava TaxID=2320271 RepID=A0A3A1WJQ6_9HYPH|nr:nuclear transport factor 2 family protein [Aureimonas flava]RIY01389.1 nuclear transport factor 2 family protein [Aureimonas flava]